MAQEAFVQAFFHLSQLREPEALRGWLCRIAHRLALMHLRERREEPLAPAEVARVQGLADRGFDESASLLLGRLPEGMRQAVTLTYLAGYTCAEAGELLGVREGTIKSRLSRARAVLKEDFEMAKRDASEHQPQDEFTEKTLERLLREARRLLATGDIEAAARKADEAMTLNAEQFLASGAEAGFRVERGGGQPEWNGLSRAAPETGARKRRAIWLYAGRTGLGSGGSGRNARHGRQARRRGGRSLGHSDEPDEDSARWILATHAGGWRAAP